MSTTVNRSSFVQMCNEDLAWLKDQPDSLEKAHIEAILKTCPDAYYNKKVGDLTSQLSELKAENEALKQGSLDIDLLKYHIRKVVNAALDGYTIEKGYDSKIINECLPAPSEGE